MREILFRGKRIDNGEWVDGHLCKDGFGKMYIIHYVPSKYNNVLPERKVICVDPETVCQFTGLTDKNGTKVFEGDIMRIITFGFDKELFVTNVKFGARSGVQGFYLANGRSMFYFGQTDLSRMDDGEVIGNIFDNPKLMEGGEADETD